jgi:hypothetical protein
MTRKAAFLIGKLGRSLLFGVVCPLALAPAALALDDDASGDGQLDQIIVTASKRAESIQDVPSTVNAVSGVQLEQLNASRRLRRQSQPQPRRRQCRGDPRWPNFRA